MNDFTRSKYPDPPIIRIFPVWVELGAELVSGARFLNGNNRFRSTDCSIRSIGTGCECDKNWRQIAWIAFLRVLFFFSKHYVATASAYIMNVVFRQAVCEDLDKLDEILIRTSAEVNDPEVFVTDDRAYLSRHIAEDGFILIALVSEEAAGFLLVDFPDGGDADLAHDLGWESARRLLGAHMDIACVLPEYRGFGLQKRLLRESEGILLSMGYRYALATVYPDNQPSVRSLLSSGYVIGATGLKYGGVLRHTVWKELHPPLPE